ncbi:hypothetical protein M407DRAFT_117567 [Tulasnella calospora MUT 4182]|uniref:Uncharacterized protein n=1 Tax=Tulasnella calospora MUT 4182 TaxID=1051891 RepID=A0A0C3KMB6_9AGAM|nr:hypothetical protein M407DRAFT_117567 [Tulasnella calospora MUT 4182]
MLADSKRRRLSALYAVIHAHVLDAGQGPFLVSVPVPMGIKLSSAVRRDISSKIVQYKLPTTLPHESPLLCDLQPLSKRSVHCVSRRTL